MQGTINYAGEELELFREASNWKKYFSRFILPHVRGRVLEVGAGLGTTTSYLKRTQYDAWVLLEPDKEMATQLAEECKHDLNESRCLVINGTINDIGPDLFDTIIYIDVLEHIGEDRWEILKASTLLREGGKIIVLSPAFQWLVSPFDKAIGHYRRYTKKTLLALAPPTLKAVVVKYLDTGGLFLSLGNRLLLQQRYPRKAQVYFWDKYFVPIAVFMDRLFLYSFGRSIFVVWQKASPS
ncbi:MAG TPA: class I SAM-dependent methyltransferase [Chitinophagaceae bacterium]|nr:class I SAM-dependent methyltransferase [Chitinophagaceae bacterium]